jgi:hypothetical protein
MRPPLATLVMLGALTGSCAAMMPAIPNPDGLPANALTLQHVLDRGCLPYILGRASEQQAMSSLRLNHIRSIMPSFLGPPPPMWMGSYPGLSNVLVGPQSCSINMHRGDVESYRRATRAALRH